MPWVLQWSHGKIQSVKKGAAIIIRFRLGSAGVDIDDPTNRHLGCVTYVSSACHALARAKMNTGCVEIC